MDHQAERRPLVLVPSDWDADKKGRFLEQLVSSLLRRQRFHVTERVRFTGMEIDLLADNKDTGQRAFVECKFVRDPLSANVVDLLLGKAFRRQVDLAYLFSTAPPGREARGVIDEIVAGARASSPRFAFIGPNEIADILEESYSSPIPETFADRPIGLPPATLLVAPEIDPIWVLEEVIDGIPSRALLVRERGSITQREIQYVRRLFEGNRVFEGLEVVPLTHAASGPSGAQKSAPTAVETVAPVLSAENLIDYRPCRPTHFVGRHDLQREVWGFLQSVRGGGTPTRVVALSGPSGFGKSSLVVKLADRARNRRWRGEFFVQTADTRAARGPLFVASALKTAFDNATASGFISPLLSPVTLGSSESLLESPSVSDCLKDLKQHRRVLVVFFDQFEEVLSKSELHSVFEAFRKLAFEVNARQDNLVVGFSWRTGITLPDGNPAYHLWHSLADIRVNLAVDRFSGKESSQLVTLFQGAMRQRLLRPLRRRLIEQGQGVPWLLKKICIHVYREVEKGVQQHELLERRLNVRSLFDEDLELLSTDAENSCLRYVAARSPVEVGELLEKFSEATINALYEKRLVVRTGQKYATYWDVFRDFILGGAVPPIPWTYVPVVPVSMAMRALVVGQRTASIDLMALVKQLGYTRKTVVNIVSDLQNLVLLVRNADGSYSVQPDLAARDLPGIARYLHDLFADHVAFAALDGCCKPGGAISLNEFESAVSKTYTELGVPPDFSRQYGSRLHPWLRFAGFVELDGESLRRPSGGLGRESGKVAWRRGASNGPRGWTFLGAASPRRVLDLARMLLSAGRLPRSEVSAQGNRNAAAELVNLRLAIWEKGELTPSGELADCPEDLRAVVVGAARQTPFPSISIAELQRDAKIDATDLGELLSKALGKAWKPASKHRNGGAAKAWVRFISKLEEESPQG